MTVLSDTHPSVDDGDEGARAPKRKPAPAPPVDPAPAPAADAQPTAPASGYGDEDEPLPADAIVKPDKTTTTKDGKPTAARRERLVPAAPTLTAAGGGAATLIPMVAQATTPTEFAIFAGVGAGAGALAVARRMRKARLARERGATGARTTRAPHGGRGGFNPLKGIGGGHRKGGGRGLGLGSSSGGGGGKRGTSGARSGGLGGLAGGRKGAGAGSKLGKALRSAGLGSGGPKKTGGLLSKGPKAGKRGLFGSGSQTSPGGRAAKAASAARRAKEKAAQTRAGKAAARGLNGTARTPIGRAAGKLGRAMAAPFRAGSYGTTGSKGAKGWRDAARRARKQQMKDRAKGRTRRPFSGWGAAAAGLGAYGARRFARGFVKMWMWNPWNADEAKASQGHGQKQQPTAAKPNPQKVGDRVRPDPNAPTQQKQQQPKSTTPQSVPKTPVQPIGAKPTPQGEDPMKLRPGSNTGGSALISHMQAAAAEQRRRSSAGARPGILDVVDDAQRIAIAVGIMAEILQIESAAYERFPFHPAVKQAMAAAVNAVKNAGGVMLAAHGTIEQVHKEDLRKLRTPYHTNAQMWDQRVNGGANGGA